MIIKNAKVFTEEGVFIKKDLFLKNDRIVDCDEGAVDVLDAEGLYAIPGLTDLHFHGCVGYDFCDGTGEAITAIATYQADHGITNIIPATMTLGDDELLPIFKSAAQYRLRTKNHSGLTDKDRNAASLVGIHMEGPYLSRAKKGAQKEDFLKHPDITHYRKMQEAADGLIKLVSIAPEEDGALEFIHTLKDEVVISLAHTTADYTLASEAFTEGAGHVTHLFNAMPAFSHRSPGVIGAALDAPHVKVELICDGIHIHPSMIRAAFSMFTDERIVLVSDSMMATGLEDGDYTLGGQKVTVKGKVATLSDGTLAGSVTNLMDCMRNVVSFGIPLESAVKCAAVNPVKQAGLYNEHGSLTPGKIADVVLLDSELNLHTVILRGRILDQ